MTNLIPNPGFETDLSGWSRADTGLATVTRSTAEAHSGAASMKWDTTAATNVANTNAATIAAVPGTTYRGGIWAKGTGTVAVGVAFHDAGAAQLGTTRTGPDVVLPAGLWVPLTVSEALAPATAAYQRLRIYQRTAGAQTVYLDDAELSPVTKLTATVLPELAAVRLEVIGATAGPLPITRTDHNGAGDVRQLEGQETSAGTLIVTDYEPALFGPVTYSLLDHDAAPVTATVQLDAARPIVAVAVSPATRAAVVAFTGVTETVDNAGTVHRILDAPAPLVVYGLMSTRSGSLEAWCASYEDAAALREVLATGELVMVRHPEHRGMDVYAHVVRATVSPRPTLVHDAATGAATLRWSVTFDYLEQLAPTGPLLSAAGWNYAALEALGLTYTELAATFATYNAMAVGP